MDGANSFSARPLHGESVVNQVVRAITDAIIAGELKAGNRLPTETELCESFGVGRNSVREAIKILEAYGIVNIRRAEGTFVNDSYNHRMLDPMLYGILLENNFRSDIVALRKVFDTGILYQLMQSVTEGQMEEIRSQMEALERTAKGEKPDPKKVLQADMDFHMAMARCTENQLLQDMYEYVDRITAPSRTKTVEQMLGKRQEGIFVKLHQEIICLLEEKDYRNIERVLREHYQFWAAEGAGAQSGSENTLTCAGADSETAGRFRDNS